MNVLSLFAGIGGLELGLERAGMTTVGQVELDPRPHSCATTNVTDARHSPSGQRIQPSIQPGTHLPSCSTSTARGSGKRRTSSDTTQTVGAV